MAIVMKTMEAIRRYIKDNPLGRRVLTYILFCSTCLAFVATGLQLFLDYRNNMSVIEMRMSDINRSYPDTIAASLWNVDGQQIHIQIAAIASLPDIVSVRLYDPERKIIQEAGTASATNMTVTEAFPIEYAPRSSSKEKVLLGTLEVTASVERIYNDLRNKALIILAAQTTKTTIVAIFTLFIFNRLVSRHLSVLATFARKLDLKNIGNSLVLSRRPPKRKDELDLVVLAINSMATSIKRDYDEIEKYRIHLEELVESRTTALAQKVDEKEFVIQAMNREIKERELAEIEAKDNEERYRQLVDMSPDAITIESDQKIVFLNNGALELLRANNVEQIQGRSLLDFIPVEWQEIAQDSLPNLSEGKTAFRPFECKMLRFDGDMVDVEISRAIFQYKGVRAVQTVIHDITKYKHYEDQLRKQALHDALTGLPNRLLLSNRIEYEVAIAAREKKSVYVLFFDLDRFKYVNDMFGHDTGDVLLKTFAARMSSCLRKSDTLARLGGDEFVLLVGNVADESEVFKLIDKLLKVIAEPVMIENQEITITASIGLSIYPQDGEDVGTLLKRADSAMYQAKAQGRNNVRKYTTDIQARVNEHLVMESRLRYALERNELVLYYQPLINSSTGRVVGAEALLRWKHPELGLVAPGRFIPLAEETGLILPIGDWVMRSACMQLKNWQALYMPQLRVSVNLSVQQLVRPDLENDIKRILQDTGLIPEYLELEITESVSMTDPERIAILLKKLKTMGMALAIDDFGTGYSNLSYLKQFPVDHLKLDRIFVKDIARDTDDAMLTRAIIDIAHNLQIRVVAEGVEDAEQLKQLISYGCDEIQGYYFSRPLPVDEFSAMLQRVTHPNYLPPLDQIEILQDDGKGIIG